MRGSLAKAVEAVNLQRFRQAPLPRSYVNHLGRQVFFLLLTVQGLVAFALITLGGLLRQRGLARSVIQPRIRQEITRAGVALLPMFVFMALALGSWSLARPWRRWRSWARRVIWARRW